MCHLLRREHWEILSRKPRLVNFLMEEMNDGRTRFFAYRVIAEGCLKLSGNVDHLGIPPGSSSGLPFTADTDYQESDIALWIDRYDGVPLGGMLRGEGIGEAEIPKFRKLYARIFIGHENDVKCETILGELGRRGFSVAGTCL